MSLKSILVHLDIGAPADNRIELALKLSERLDATVIGIGACAFEPIVQPEGAFSFASITVQTRDEIKAELSEMGNKFAEAAAARKVKAEWRQSLELPADAVSRAARSADIIVSRPNAGRQWDPFRMADVADIVMKSGRPVLVVPAAGAADVPKRAMVAWKDTREARRAVKDAVPILKLADEVLVATIAEGDDAARSGGDDVVAYLAHHGIKARADNFERGEAGVGDRVLSIAAEFDADLVVAGAYGHSRFREWAFGGVTRDLLSEMPTTACLLAN